MPKIALGGSQIEVVKLIPLMRFVKLRNIPFIMTQPFHLKNI